MIIRVIATICSLTSPDQCVDKLVTDSNMEDISMQACLMGMPALAHWMESFPTYRLASWRCQMGERPGHDI